MGKRNIKNTTIYCLIKNKKYLTNIYIYVIIEIYKMYNICRRGFSVNNKNLYLSEVIDWTNVENLNFKGMEIRKGVDKADLSKYDNPDKPILFSKYMTILDILNLDSELLRYPMGVSSKMKMVNIILQAKGLLADIMPEASVEISSSSKSEYIFILSFTVMENYNTYSRISISTDRSYNISMPTENDNVNQIFGFIIEKFLELASTP